ncbi:hypothetical protein [Amycolatopsis sp. w19]|uniref:hypothetical protein n=1 Tax=Amycolatopsis sp. w19 TaxID=3448134 RepID=UPI003F1E093B
MTVIFGIWLVLRPFRDKVMPGGRIRIKALFFEIEIGPPAPTPKDAAGETSEQQPPASDVSKLADSDPPS